MFLINKFSIENLKFQDSLLITAIAVDFMILFFFRFPQKLQNPYVFYPLTKKSNKQKYKYNLCNQLLCY
jgi:hypothetical protein